MGRASIPELVRVAAPVDRNDETVSSPRGALAMLSLGALGIVFGDIGTSPLYALRTCLAFFGREQATRGDVFGMLSLVFWALTMVVSVKYLIFVMRADNHGQGGIFALLALATRPGREIGADRPRWLAVLVVIGAALLYGDGMITPAISVLSAMEGLRVATPRFSHLVIPLACLTLVALFAVQRRGTGKVGMAFGPVMLVWFVTIGALGGYHIASYPSALEALSPVYAVRFFIANGLHGVLVLGAVVLAVTGGEALYADMGNFGKRPIRVAWLLAVMPALLLNYFGQGAMLLAGNATDEHLFFAMVPTGPATYALVGLSTAATVIASQALISGVFALTSAAVQLGYFPRVEVKYTSREAEGQIYIPAVNAALAVACLTLVLTFRSSTRLASAYGIAVTGTMVITSIAFFEVTRRAWHWKRWQSVLLLLVFLTFDIPFFVANLFKFWDGGYVPILVAAVLSVVMLTWHKVGRHAVQPG